MNNSLIRIVNITLSNIKNVADGSISLNEINDDTLGASIVGIYGQNGSGKTALIWALSLLKMLFLELHCPEIPIFISDSKLLRQQSK